MVAPLCCSSHWPVVLLPALATEAQIPISFLIGQAVLQHHGNRGRGTSLQNLSHHLAGVELRSKGGAGDAKETGSPILSSQLGGEPSSVGCPGVWEAGRLHLFISSVLYLTVSSLALLLPYGSCLLQKKNQAPVSNKD